MSWHIRDLAWVLTFIVLGSTTMTLLFLANLSGLDLPGDINMDREADPGDPEIDDISLEPLRMRTSMYVGVMTAQVFLHTRATACNNTWGRYVPKLEFFCHLDEDGKEAAKDLPLIHMEGKYGTFIVCSLLTLYSLSYFIHSFSYLHVFNLRQFFFTCSCWNTHLYFLLHFRRIPCQNYNSLI